MNKLSLFAAALALATAAFWATMLTSPPTSEASAPAGRVGAELSTADHCVSFGVCP
ncbi:MULTISPECIES: hypothetical protein [unclassified Methylobacterium]|uniref:hypothetical protein n=1 Tax=unclassified Methylobacterium TaxID=2615210 RepID=UPI0003182E90|nr:MULTISPECIES: hypothetical protein [Methylobacterium]WFT79147.1 hypothetical protein QA634_28605 [Methylobacterium nodulans]